MRATSRAWPAFLAAGIVLALTITIPAAGSDRYERSLQANDGYGDFHTLFISQGEETTAQASTLTTSPAFDLRGQGEEPLAWAIHEDRLPNSFTWVVKTLDKTSRTVLRLVEKITVTSPLQFGILLTGSSMICLIGIRRRDRTQL